MQYKYNLKKQTPDLRDFQLTSVLNMHASVKLPKAMDIISKCPPVYDQLELGSCTANAGVAARWLLGDVKIQLSRLYQYFEERFIEGDANQDGGAQMRDIGKAMATYGICPETDFPYDITKFTNAPTPKAVADAVPYKIKSYYSVTTTDQIKQVLALKQHGVLVGMDVYSSFESDKVASNGIVSLPNIKKEKLLGGHAVLAVGYNSKYIIMRNSWGSGWADKGYFYLPYTYFTKGYAYDFWIIQN
jgi:C1A family cysteine protease